MTQEASTELVPTHRASRNVTVEQRPAYRRSGLVRGEHAEEESTTRTSLMRG